MSELNEREAIAKALYMEFREGVYTYQVVAVPSAVSLDKSKVYDAGLAHRRISHWSPRRNWKFTTWGPSASRAPLARTPMGEFEQIVDQAQLDEAVKSNIEYIEDAIGMLARRGYTTPHKSFAVEMSEKDYKSFTKDSKLSADLYRRITRSRASFGYPEELFPLPEPAAPATPTPVTYP